jgi:DNA adenine methylase
VKTRAPTNTSSRRDVPRVTALNQWYGADRMVVERIGRELAGCAWVGVPCGGGMGVLHVLTARSVLVGDVHRHMINMSRVIRDDSLRAQLKEKLRLTLFHPDELAAAQRNCRAREARWLNPTGTLFGAGGPAVGRPAAGIDDAHRRSGSDEPDLAWAFDYFVCSWMGQGGRAGTRQEFDGCQSVRYDAGGGGSAKRFRSMIESLDAWGKITAPCEFVVRDVFDFLTKCHDRPGHGIYIDPPWKGDGDGDGLLYKFPFTDADHRRLARAVARFEQTRVVVRYGDHPLIRELYPAVGRGGEWRYVERVGRDQTNQDKPELLIINGPSMVEKS